MQWAHLVSAIVAVGGTAFLRFVLLPAAAGLDDAAFGTASPLYLNILLVKIALALVVFGVAFALTIPGGMFAGMQARRKAWLTVNVALALVVVFLSAYLRRM
jgi:hypothetical protein